MDERIRAFIDANVPAIASKVAGQVRACVCAKPEPQPDDAIPVGASKFGGRPDVCSGFNWPMTKDGPCWFVAQISLREINEFETGWPLPREGLLSFFYHDAGGPAGQESKVYLFADAALRRIERVRDTRYAMDFDERHFFSRALFLSQGWCLPNDASAFGLTDEEKAAYDGFDDFVESFNGDFADGVHQLFGLPQYSKPPTNHQLLASFGQVQDRYFYYIATSVVPALDFRQLKVVYECT